MIDIVPIEITWRAHGEIAAAIWRVHRVAQANRIPKDEVWRGMTTTRGIPPPYSK